MRAYLIDKPGGSTALYSAMIDLPTLGREDVLIETKAISINPADVKVKLAEEGLQMVGGDVRPLILGWDVAGIVSAVGDAVTDLNIGDRVFGMVNFPGQGKTYAEYVSAPRGHLARIPDGIGFKEAAATTLAALTALQVLDGHVHTDSRVLIHAGSGGVGHFAIQIAKSMGAHVITTTSAKNRDFVLGLGVDEHIDYRETDFSIALRDLDFVFDTQGGEILKKSLSVVRSGGLVRTIAAMGIDPKLQALADGLGVDIDMDLVHSNGADMVRLADMLRAGTLVPTIDNVFDFENLPDAHTYVEAGRSVGKVVVTL